MDTKNPTKGKKGLWIKIVAAVVIVGALVTVGVLGTQGDWLQGSIRSLSKPVLKTTTSPTKPDTTTKSPVTTTKTVAPVCGNGKIESGEKCDDGNTKSLDGCSSKCIVEPDLCSNIEGNQYVVPSGYTLSGTTCMGGPGQPLPADPFVQASPEQVTITSNPPVSGNRVLLTYPEKVTIIRSKLPLDTVATEWGYDPNYFTCILPITDPDQEKLICTPKTATYDVYSGIAFNWCVTGNICQWSNYIYVEVLPAGPVTTDTLNPEPTETVLQVQ